jgi:hypothetical protein
MMIQRRPTLTEESTDPVVPLDDNDSYHLVLRDISFFLVNQRNVMIGKNGKFELYITVEDGKVVYSDFHCKAEVDYPGIQKDDA